ncbi:hypothetical protein SISNIDRAFT_280177 [Sistotremastrum niveocremeum HHB9708]|nr:hypothetical protein SISNIDRAFT_280177 [Sistotremastrum niveocremeum HHB9708]
MLLLGWMFWSIWNPPDATSRSAGSKPKVDSRNRGRHDHESSAGLLPSQVHQYPPITSDQPRRSKVSFGTSNRKPRRDEASDDDGSFEGNGKWENGERFFPSQITQMNNIIAR